MMLLFFGVNWGQWTPIFKRCKVQSRAYSGFADKSVEEPKHSNQVLSKKEVLHTSKQYYVSGRITTFSRFGCNFWPKQPDNTNESLSFQENIYIILAPITTGFQKSFFSWETVNSSRRGSSQGVSCSTPAELNAGEKPEVMLVQQGANRGGSSLLGTLQKLRKWKLGQ